MRKGGNISVDLSLFIYFIIQTSFNKLKFKDFIFKFKQEILN